MIITIFNRKGGVGKTTTALAFAAGLAQRNFKVLAIDLDAQCNFTSTMNIKTAIGSFDVLTQKTNINDAIIKNNAFDILPATTYLSGADSIITKVGKEYRLKEAIQKLEVNYDYIVIDTPPTIGILSTNAMTVADKLIITVQADAYSADGLMQIDEIINEIKKYCNNNLKVAGILLTRYNPRSVLSKTLKGMFDKIALKMNTKVFNTFIRENVAIKEAQAMKQTIFEYDKNSNGAKDYNKVIDEFLKK